MSFIELFEQFMLFFFTPKCYENVFLGFNFTDIGCFKYALSKALGYGILMGSLMIKVPQILTILKHKSAEGISLTAESLMLMAVVGQIIKLN
jgi:mannose-P-dolichol utilization defect protein 1